MFQNMGPAPSGRSGHAMASAGSKVFVLGGESFTTPRPDDPGMIHVLDTSSSYLPLRVPIFFSDVLFNIQYQRI
jgi:hypothetical protein